MSGPYDIRTAFFDQPIAAWMTILRCPDPDNCDEMHMEHEDDDVLHHYGCDCGACQYECWVLKH